MIGLQTQNRQQLFDLELSYEKHDYETYFGGSPTEASEHSAMVFTNMRLSIFIREIP
jgi:hypothetical protein